MKTTLLTSDLHFTDSPKDEYRFDIFQWLSDKIKKHNVEELIILGDLTDRKDNHSSKLVNSIIKNLFNLRKEHEIKIKILKGNHDFVDKNSPFFKFLNNVPSIKFISRPKLTGDNLFLPYSANPEKEWENIEFIHSKRIYIHQEVIGCTFANQQETRTGICNDFFSKRGFKGIVFSGHIHVPQTLDYNITYVGAPYSVRHGDHYEGRVLILKNDKKIIEEFPNFHKRYSVNIQKMKELEQFSIKENDELKVTVCLHKSEIFEYKEICKEIKQWCNKKNIILSGIKPKVLSIIDAKIKDEIKVLSDIEILEEFSKKEKLNKETIDIGKQIIK